MENDGIDAVATAIGAGVTAFVAAVVEIGRRLKQPTREDRAAERAMLRALGRNQRKMMEVLQVNREAAVAMLEVINHPRETEFSIEPVARILERMQHEVHDMSEQLRQIEHELERIKE